LFSFRSIIRQLIQGIIHLNFVKATLFFSFLFLSINACHHCKSTAGTSGKALTPISEDSVKAICTRSLGTTSFRLVPNENDSLSLAFTRNERTAQQPIQITRYVIVDRWQNLILKKGELRDGSIEWIARKRLKVEQKPGMISSDPEFNKTLTTQFIDL